MASSPTPNRRVIQVLALFALIIPVTFILLGGKPLPIFLSTIFSLSAWMISFMAWITLADPGVQGTYRPALFCHYLLRTLTGRDNFVIVSVGQSGGDYFLLKNKSNLAWVYSTSESAVVIRSGEGKLALLPAGLTRLKKGETLFASFCRLSQSWEYGPRPQEQPFSRKRAQESQTEHHARHLRIQKGLAVTRDAHRVAASFILSFSAPSRENVLQIAGVMPESPQNGDGGTWLQEWLGLHVRIAWQQEIADRTLEELRGLNLERNLSGTMNEVNRALHKKLGQIEIHGLQVNLQQFWME